MNEIAASVLRHLGQTTVEASLLIGLILITRMLFKERLSPRWQYALWFLVCLKILIPWTPYSAISLSRLVPETLTPIPAVNTALSPLQEVSEPHTNTIPWALWSAVGVWMGGVVCIGLYLLRDYQRLTRLVNHCPTLTAQPALDLLDHCCAQLHIRTRVRLVITDAVKSPALLGVLRPKLLLPKGMVHRFTKRQLRHVFLHELAHLKRQDIAASCVGALCHLLHWFNPLVWYAFQLMRTDRELACDQVALTHLARSEQSTLYGQTIIRVLEFNRCHPLRAALAGMGQTRHQVRKRIVSIAEFEQPYEGIQWGAACLLACLAVTGLTRTNLTAPNRPHTVSTMIQTEPSPPAQVEPIKKISLVASADPGLAQPLAQDTTSETPAATSEKGPDYYRYRVSPEEYVVTSQQFQHIGLRTHTNAATIQARMQHQAELNARQMAMMQKRVIKQVQQQRRFASSMTPKRRRRPKKTGLAGIIEMAATQSKLNGGVN